MTTPENWFQTNDGRLLSPEVRPYLTLTPELYTGELGKMRRRSAIIDFVEQRYQDVQEGRIDAFDPLEINAAGCAAAELACSEPERHSGGERPYILHHFGVRANSFFEATMARGDDPSRPEIQDDDQFHKAFLYLSTLPLLRPMQSSFMGKYLQQMRIQTAARLKEVHARLYDAYDRPDSGDSQTIKKLLGARAELAVACLLMRRAADGESRHAASLVVPSLVRHDNPFRPLLKAEHWDASWDNTVWSLGNQAILAGELTLATPPDARVQVKYLGSEEDEKSYAPSISYISLARHVFETRDENRVDAAVNALWREATSGRNRLHRPEVKEFLDAATIRARERLVPAA